MYDDESALADIADTLAYAAEQIDEFTREEICVLLAEAADEIDSLRRQVAELGRGKRDGDGHHVLHN